MSIERALELADGEAGRGYPNPTVGAVVVSADGALIGEGVTEPAGGRHGEIVALDAAGAAALGATLYVTMEPCTHHGRTPPCVDRIVEAGITRVVAGCLDPNPLAGGGLERLRANGIDTELLDLPRGAAPERGVADLDRAAAAARHPQARRLGGRPRRRPGTPLGHGRGVEAACARAARLGRRGRRGDGDGARRRAPARRARRARRQAAAPPRLRARPVARGLGARAPKSGRSRTSWPRSPAKACSRFSSKAGRPSLPLSSRIASSTGCSSSSRPCSPAAACRCSRSSRPRSTSARRRSSRSERTCSSRGASSRRRTLASRPCSRGSSER